MKKKILITAGGTATAWHLCNIIKEYFDNKLEIHICDINDEYLVASSIFAYKFHKVPSIYEDNYKEYMINLLKNEKIDIIVPLIDFDLVTFCSDSNELKNINVISTAPLLNTTETLTNKKNLEIFLKNNNIPYVPSVILENVLEDKEYVIKPIRGFGSRGVEILNGLEIKNRKLDEDMLIQEKCNKKEVTAEIFNGEFLSIFVRERVETKSGVCTKMVPFNNDQVIDSLKRLINVIKCPIALCIQLMELDGIWRITDCNLRLGAGTALSSAIGFQLARSFLATLVNEQVPSEWLKPNKKVKSVLRVYKEIVINDNNI